MTDQNLKVLTLVSLRGMECRGNLGGVVVECLFPLHLPSAEIASLRSQRQGSLRLLRRARKDRGSLRLLRCARKDSPLCVVARHSPFCLCEARSAAAISHNSLYKSRHCLFILLIKSTFFCLEPALICFSLEIALSASSNTS